MRTALRRADFLADEVVCLSGDTFAHWELINTVERVLGRPIEQVLRPIGDLKTEVEKHAEDDMRKYGLGFARGDGVA